MESIDKQNQKIKQQVGENKLLCFNCFFAQVLSFFIFYILLAFFSAFNFFLVSFYDPAHRDDSTDLAARVLAVRTGISFEYNFGSALAPELL